jgi:release factor glutamine methyltransferase
LTLGEVLRAAADYLAARGVPSPRVDAELLLAHALRLERIQLYTEHDRPVTPEERSTARELVRRRGQREPLAYVLGEWGFRRLVLKTDPRALVPRPETEIVVDRCLALLQGRERPRVLDVGTGTGAIALAIAQEHPGADVTATDLSTEALALAGENARRLGLHVDLRAADLADEDGYDLVVSNPPYVLGDELAGLEPEVREHEPRVALVDDGQTERLARAHPGEWLVLETHEGRAHEVERLLLETGYTDVRVTPDLNLVPRVVEGRWTP